MVRAGADGTDNKVREASKVIDGSANPALSNDPTAPRLSD